MQLQRFSRAGWALGGLILGAVGGFQLGRHRQETAGASGARSVPGAIVLTGSAEPTGPAAKQGQSRRSGDRSEAEVPLGDTTQRTLRNILGIPDLMARLSALRQWCRTLPPDEVLAVLKEFKGMMEAQERVGDMEAAAVFLQSVEVIAQSMFERGPEEMLAFFLATSVEGGNGDLRQGLGLEVYKRWVDSNPKAARAMLEARLAGGGKIGETETALSRHLMRSWILKEPDAAMAWLLKQPREIEDGTVSQALQSLSHSNPDKARALLEAQADRPGRAQMASVMAEWWAKSDPVKAMEWALGLPETLSGPTVQGTMKTWAEKDFPAARKAVEAMNGPAREAALPVLVEKWPGGAWHDAASFLEQQASGKGKQDAMGSLIRRWADGDQQAASAWLAKQAPGPERDAGAAALAEEVRGSDPEAAAVWGATLANEQARQESLKETFQEWYKKSVPGALKWLESAPDLTESDRAALMGSAPEQ